jgi:GTPase
VSPKRHTTRSEILGVLTEDDTQLVLMDTPGVVAAKDQTVYESGLVRSPWDALFDADVALVVIDAAKRLYDAEMQMLERIQAMQEENPRFPFCLALNKVDLVRPKERLLPLCHDLNEMIDFKTTHFLCGKTGDGVSELVSDLLAMAQPGAWEFDAGVRSDQSIAQRIEEVVKERLFTRFHQELPYQSQQHSEELVENPDGSVLIHHVIVVKTTGQKAILTGKSGKKVDPFPDSYRPCFSPWDFA